MPTKLRNGFSRPRIGAACHQARTNSTPDDDTQNNENSITMIFDPA
jgi:hypothetical protein